MSSILNEGLENASTNYTTLNNSNRINSEGRYDFESLLFFQATKIAWKCCPPVIILLGTFGNGMTIVIMRRISKCQSSSTMFLYFIALAVSDLILLYFGLLRKWLVQVFDIDFNAAHDVICKLQGFLVYTCGMTSAWFIVSMTIQRVMSVVWPHYKSLLCKRRTHDGLVIGVTVVIFASLNIYKLLVYVVKKKINSTGFICGTIDDRVLTYFDLFVHPFIDLVVTSLVPFSILIVGNSVLLWKVIQSVQVARVMTAGGCDQVNSRQKKASSLTVTLMTVSMAFLILTLPVCIYLIVNHVINELTSWKSKFIWAVCYLSWYTNSAINFYLYCLSGARFRNEVKRLFCEQDGIAEISTRIVASKIKSNIEV